MVETGGISIFARKGVYLLCIDGQVGALLPIYLLYIIGLIMGINHLIMGQNHNVFLFSFIWSDVWNMNECTTVISIRVPSAV